MFSRYRAHLEAELLRQELLLKEVIAEKERTIQRQDEEIRLLRAKNARLEIIVVPGLRSAPANKNVAPRPLAPEGETSWTSYLNRHMQEEEKAEKEAKEQANNGISLEKRPGVHQPASGNAQRPNGGSAPDAKTVTSGDA